MLFSLSRSWIVSFPPLDGLNKEQTRDYSDHDFQVLVVHRQFLTTKQMDTNGALVRAGLQLNDDPPTCIPLYKVHLFDPL